MKNITTLLAAGLLASVPAAMQARHLTPAESLRAVQGEKSLPMRAPGNINVTPVFTLQADGADAVYVFAGTDGYLVTAADDAVANLLLGYSDTGQFSASDMPPQMRWWLRQMADQVAYAASHPQAAAARKAMRTEESRHAVAPITKTLWNQDAPYNDDCPVLTSSSGSNERSVTGCVATAMAQVLKVFDYPEKGKGSHSYSFTYEGNSYTQSFDFGNTTFKWADMNDVYDSESSETSNEAVATLMKACGVSVDMSYGLAATDGSGAASDAIPGALVNYFDYDKGIRFLERAYYPGAEWTDIVYAELAAGRPVLYGGVSEEGGHQFVCDGYSADDYFHINWGWGGMSNGYFLLWVLDPESQGIGGSDSGFNMDQCIVVGICPPDTPGATGHVVPQMCLSGPFTPQQSSYMRYEGNDVVFGEQEETLYYNTSVAAIDVTMGLKLKYDNGDVQYVASSMSGDLPVNHGWYQLSIDSSLLPVGNYTVSPAFRTGGEWYDVATPISMVGSIAASVTEDTVTFTVPQTAVNAQVTASEQKTPVYVGDLAEFLVTITATGDFYGTVIPVLVMDGEMVAQGTSKGVSLNAGETTQLDWVTTFSSSYGTIEPGDYELVYVNGSGESMSQAYSVTVQAEQTTTPEVQVTSVTFNNVSGNGTAQSPYLIYSTDLDCTVTIESVSGYWADDVIGVVFNSNTGRSVYEFGDAFVALTEGSQKNVNLQGEAADLELNSVYIFSPYAKSKKEQLLDQPLYFKMTTSDVGSVELTGTEEDAPEYYNLQGVRIEKPTHGIYLVRTGGKVQKMAF